MITRRDVGEFLFVVVVTTVVILGWGLFVAHLEAGGRAGG